MGRRLKFFFLIIILIMLISLVQCKNDLFDSIKTTVKTISILSPNGGDILIPGTSLTIRWEASFDEDLVIELLKDGSFFSKIKANAPNTGQYVWQIPTDQTTGSDFGLRIKSVKDPVVFDDSDGLFAITKLNVVSPAAGSIYGDGESVSITWAGLLDSQNNINLYLHKNDVYLQDIVLGALNDGAYNWAFPGTLANGDDYTIRITNTDTADTNYSDAFVIVHDVTVSLPNGSEVFIAGSDNTVTWQPDYAGDVSIELLDSGTPVTTIQAAASGGSHTWSTPLLTYGGDQYTIQITTATTAVKTDDSDAVFTILNPPQNVTASDGTYYDKIEVSWDSVPGATDYLLYRADAAGGPYSHAGTYAGTTANMGALMPDPTIYYFRVRARRNGVSSLDSDYDDGNRNRFLFNWTWGTTGTGNSQFNKPTDIDVWLHPNPSTPGSSTLYVTDSGNDRVQWFYSNGSYGGQWGSSGNGDGNFDSPRGICVDRDDSRVYVADTFNHRIQVFDLSGNFQSWWGKDNSQGTGVHTAGTASSPTNGSGDGEFNWPWDVAVDSSYVYVVDSENNRVQKFSKAGVFQGWWGKDSSEGTGWHDPGTANEPESGFNEGEFFWPEGITVDGEGNVYVTGPSTPTQKFTSTGTYLLTTSWGAKKISYDQDGHIYDIYPDRLTMYDPDGTYQGRFGTGGTGNGQFEYASGIAMIPNWAPALANIYVADQNNDRIQVIWRWE